MQVRKLLVLRWQESTAPDEQLLRQRMHEQGLVPYTWSNEAGDRYAMHSHSYEKVLCCVRGSIRFVLPDRPEGIDVVELASGDCMYLPPDIRHSALVGPQGVTCLEAPRY